MRFKMPQWGTRIGQGTINLISALSFFGVTAGTIWDWVAPFGHVSILRLAPLYVAILTVTVPMGCYLLGAWVQHQIDSRRPQTRFAALHDQLVAARDLARKAWNVHPYTDAPERIDLACDSHDAYEELRTELERLGVILPDSLNTTDRHVLRERYALLSKLAAAGTIEQADRLGEPF